MQTIRKQGTLHSPLEQEPGSETVHGYGEEALGLRAVDVHGDDLLDPRHLQHPGDQLGRDGLPLVRLLVVASVKLGVSLEIWFMFLTSRRELAAAPL